MNNSAKTASAHRDPIPPAASPLPAAGLGPLGVAALIVAALYVGREVFVPVALAVLLSFVLAPLIRLLQRARVPRVMAVLAVVIVAFAAISGIAGLMATQVTQLAGDLPRYQSTMREKIASLRGSAASSGALPPPTSFRTSARNWTGHRIPWRDQLARSGRAERLQLQVAGTSNPFRLNCGSQTPARFRPFGHSSRR